MLNCFQPEVRWGQTEEHSTGAFSSCLSRTIVTSEKLPVPIQNLNPDHGARRVLASLQCGRSSAPAENLGRLLFGSSTPQLVGYSPTSHAVVSS